MEKTTIKSPIKKNQLTFYHQIERMKKGRPKATWLGKKQKAMTNQNQEKSNQIRFHYKIMTK